MSRLIAIPTRDTGWDEKGPIAMHTENARVTIHCVGKTVMHVEIDGREVPLGPMERTLFGTLARHLGVCVDVKELARMLCTSEACVKNLVCSMRKKLPDRTILDWDGPAIRRNGRRYGLSGYRLVRVTIEWIVSDPDDVSGPEVA